MINDYLITIDVDWVSDAVITEIADYLIDNKIKTTWFVTHDSPGIRRLFDYPNLFELGIHPNFNDESSHGAKPEDVMSYLKMVIPQAKSVRTHSLMQSSVLLKMMREEFDIFYDVSLLLPDTPNIIPHEIFYSKGMPLLRFPFFWEDDLEMYKPNYSFSLSNSKYHVNGLKIFNFHPIHIVLNSYTMENYNLCKSAIDTTSCPLFELQDYMNTSQEGTGTFFKELVQFIKNSQKFPKLTISDLALKWKCLGKELGNNGI